MYALPPDGFDSVTVIVSLSSSWSSSSTVTLKTFEVSPGAKVSVPLFASQSSPASALPSEVAAWTVTVDEDARESVMANASAAPGPSAVSASATDSAGGPRTVAVTVSDSGLPPGVQIAPAALQLPVVSGRRSVTAPLPDGQIQNVHRSNDQGAARCLLPTVPPVTWRASGTAWFLSSVSVPSNTAPLLNTRRLIAFGKEAEGKSPLEAQVILNHKDAIELLVDEAEKIGFNRQTILNLHASLANKLLDDPSAAGRLRRITVEIGRSVFHPLDIPQIVEDCFDQALATADAIEEPFEQALFAMVHLPYLQPFDDVNKRVSRLAANMSLIKANLTPLSFVEVPVDLYAEAMYAVYELKQIDLLKDVFIWACERSASRYAAVRQSLGEPNPFRLKHRDALREIVRTMVIEQLGRISAAGRIERWAREHVEADERDRFREVVEDEVLGLHEGNFAR